MLEITPKIWRVTTPLPFRPHEVHAYLAELGGGGWMLLDGGVGTEEAWEVLDAAVRAVAGAWNQVRLQVVSHLHLDHLGLAARVQGECGVPTAMHRLDADRSRSATADPADDAAYRATLLREAGVPESVARIAKQVQAATQSLAPPVAPDHPLDGGGGPLALAPEWEWVWTPGHTAGHLALWRAEDRTLLGADLVLPRVSPTLGVNRQRLDPVGDYLESLLRVERLGAARVLPGHGEPLAPPAARIAELRTAAEEEGDRLQALLSPEPTSTWEVVQRRYPERHLPAPIALLAVRETRAHLDRLVAADRATRSPLPDGAVGFAADPWTGSPPLP